MSPKSHDRNLRNKTLAVIAGTVVVVAGSTIGYRQVSGGDGGGSDTANVWVESGAGACSRVDPPVTYANSASPDARCGSFDQAYDAANGSASASTVLVKAGTYSAQTLSGDRTSTNFITFNEAPGESVTIQEIISGSGDTDNIDYVEFKNFKLDGGFTSHGDATHITLNAIDGGVFSLWGGSDYVIKNGDWGPCASISSPSFAAGKCSAQGTFNNASSEIAGTLNIGGGACPGACEITNVLIENNVIHDHILYEVGDHYECIRLDNGGTSGHVYNLTVRHNNFYNCQIEAMTNTGVQNALFENNRVGSTEPTYGCDPFSTTCQGTDRVQTFGCGGMSGTVIFRYNSAANNGPIPDASGGSCPAGVIASYGNIMDVENGTTCSSNVTYSYNVFTNGGSGCSGTGNTVMTGMPYVNNSSGSSGDFHLANNTSAPNNIVTSTTMCENLGITDWDSQSRPLDSDCDAGIDERQ